MADDILVDDAFFLQGEIYERQLGQKDKAMEIYREFLNKYPGSVYAAEARKRYRLLRGDFVGQEQPQFSNALPLNIPPISKLYYKCSILDTEIIRKIIIGIYNE